ncbi:hypothetical protein Aple_085500 [Acrocarpospora pleiomorpha]|uniref:Uncharacterized protein n=1 Tax=Acrocarpospora pleiomorpha TaxID=90975 RepID=A0A5M3Y1J0_9ACTN|nr:hypothetical protein Aple_085500 [Acrocarpospora pleiomorpha]
MDRVRTDSPISATLVAWGNAWLTGHVGLDEAVDRVERAAGPQLVAVPVDAASTTEAAGSPLPAEVSASAAELADVPLRGFLADLRGEGLTSFRLALPAPGDPLGLTGPPAFTRSAVAAEQAAIAVLAGKRLGLVPAEDRRGSSYSGVRWATMPAATTDADVPQLAEAERALTLTMRSATDALIGVDGPTQGFPSLDSADEALAPGYPGRAHRLGALAARLALALRLADERGLTSSQLTTRNEALRDLDRAVRRARIAAHHAIVELRTP